MLYEIPVGKVDKLEKTIARYNRKGANIAFEKGDEVVVDGTVTYRQKDDFGNVVSSTFPCKVKCVEVFVDGKYAINGWSFVGSVEYADGGCVIRLADRSFDGKVPERFRDPNDKVCEHCRTVRARKDLYIIHNDETGEFKKVGKNCLLEYTRGMDADVCASILEAMGRFAEISSPDVEWESFSSVGSFGYGCDAETVKAHAYALVRKYGYVRGGKTVDDLYGFMFRCGVSKQDWDSKFGDLKLATDEEIAEVDAYVASMDANTEYLRNVKALWDSQFVEGRDFAIIASFFSVYFAKKARAAERESRKASEWVGNVGDRLSIDVGSARVLYTKPAYSYYGSDTYVWELMGKDGNVYVWSTTSYGLDDMAEEGLTVVATVKSHGEFRGIKQTVVTRGRLVAKGA